jgi:hypothetical protein
MPRLAALAAVMFLAACYAPGQGGGPEEDNAATSRQAIGTNGDWHADFVDAGDASSGLEYLATDLTKVLFTPIRVPPVAPRADGGR